MQTRKSTLSLVKQENTHLREREGDSLGTGLGNKTPICKRLIPCGFPPASKLLDVPAEILPRLCPG